MLGRTYIRDQIGYITIGLFVHALIDEIISENLGAVWKIAIKSVKALLSPSAICKEDWKHLVFQSYQQGELLNRMLGKFQLSLVDLLDMLQDVKNTDERMAAHNKDELIQFLSETGRQAVMDVEYRVPAGVRDVLRNNG